MPTPTFLETNCNSMDKVVSGDDDYEGGDGGDSGPSDDSQVTEDTQYN